MTPVGAGCTGGGATALALGSVGLPQVPNPAFAVTIGGGPVGPSVLLVTLQLSPVPIPIGNNCFVHVNPSTLVVTLPGGPTVPLPIPNVHPLIGNDLPLQAAAVHATTLQLATSNALVLNLGT